jgi:hypothetical protein
VVYIQSAIKRGFLRQLYAQCADSTVYLQDALLAFQASIFTPSFKTGRVVVNTSGGGQSASFNVPQLGGQFSQEQVFALSEELLEVYDTAVATLAAATPGFNPQADDTTSEPAVFNTMLEDDRLQGVRVMHGDFTAIRLPVTR